MKQSKDERATPAAHAAFDLGAWLSGWSDFPPIVQAGARVLRHRAENVPSSLLATPALRDLVRLMTEVMRKAPGVGLAAPQIGESKRLFVIDIATGDDDPSDLRVFINPQIIERNGIQSWEEGCLSFPGIHEEIERAERVKVRAQDAQGNVFELEADGLLAVAIQHENDHLDGKLLVDHLSLLRRRLVHRSMVKRAAEAQAAQ